MNSVTASEETIKAILSGGDYFTCEKAHCRMPVAACVARQKRGIGNRALGEYVIPDQCQDCTQGKQNKEVLKMSRGTCKNCERKNMSLPAGGLCGACYLSVRGKEGKDRDRALCDARVRLNPSAEIKNEEVEAAVEEQKQETGVPISISGEDLGAKARDAMTEVLTKIQDSLARELTITFFDYDLKLYDQFYQDAKKNRRPPDQHVLWIVEKYLQKMEAGGGEG